MATLLAMLGLAGCGPGGGDPDPPCDELCAQDFFSNRTAIVFTPPAASLAPGDSVTVAVTIVEAVNGRHDDFEFGYSYRLESLARVEPDEPGVTTAIAMGGGAPCEPGEIPAAVNEPRTDYFCRHATLTVATTTNAIALGDVMLEARWKQSRTLGNGPFPPPPHEVTISQTGRFSPRLTLPIELAVVPLAAVHATQGTTSIKIVRDPRFAEAVTLTLDNLGSGIGGSFAPNPVPAGVDTAILTLAIPGRYAAGGNPRLQVTGESGGVRKHIDFSQPIAPLYTVTVAAPGGGPGILTRRQPLDLDVTIEFDRAGPFALVGPGRIDLSLPDPPPDVRVQWLADAQPVSGNPATLTLRRTLRLTAEGSDGFIGNLEVRATAAQIPGEPFATASLPLQLDFATSWEYLESSAQYFLGNNDSIGIALQGNNLPAVAWLEGDGEARKAYLKRFDGTAFLPSPGAGARGLAVAGGRLEQARMAMTRAGTAYVAMTYGIGTRQGAGIALGEAHPSGVDWAVGNEIVLPAGRTARSPRLAAGAIGAAGDALAMAYVVEAGAPTAAGALLVRARLRDAALLPALPEPARTDGAINASTNGYVLRDTPSIALNDDGHPWLAWLEEESGPASRPPELWLRGHDGSRWSAPIRLPTRRPLAARPTQLLVEPGTGVLVVAWLEGSPARLMLARVDPVTGNFSELRDSANPLDGALNVTTSEGAGDIALTFDQGRVVVAWTEGPPARPVLYAKQRNGDGTWTRLGAAVDSFRPTRSPHVVGDGTGRLYLAWTGFAAGTDPLSPTPITDILVGRSVSP